MEAADAGIRVCVAITDGIPAQDMIRVKRYMRRYKAENRMRLIGPELRRRDQPRQALLGIMPGHIYLPGRVGIVGRSGTLGYEAAAQMKELGIGISTSVGIGGDPINGSSFKDALELFETRPRDRRRPDDRRDRRPAGSRGRRVRPRPHDASRSPPTSPASRAPKGRKMGHAGAIISAFGESAPEKVEILREAGVTIAPTPAELGTTMAALLARTVDLRRAG